MCGIIGFNWEDKNLIKELIKTLKHRGPDGQGYYTDNNISLGHTRLSIVDLTKTGKQPMSNPDSTIWITFNGEIYNYKEKKQELTKEGYSFNSNSDTEVIIRLYEKYKLNFINHLRGMFAFAIWDKNKKRITLARDPLGVKPLYYYYNKNKLIFSSEIKTFKAIKEIKLEVNKQAIIKLLSYRYTPDEETTFKHIKKVLPGQIIIIEKDKTSKIAYYNQKENILYKNPNQALSKTNEIISDSVEKHMIADVEVGSFLSGGIDSSIITTIAQELMKKERKNLKTFSIGFDFFSELKYSKVVAEHINSDHYELIVDHNKAIKTIPKLIWQNDEPLIDFAAIPNYLLAQFARKKVKVVLAGQGGDEVFAGYEHYKKMLKILKFSQSLPKPAIYAISLIPHKKFRRAHELLSMKDIENLYLDTYSVFKEKELHEKFNISKNILIAPIKSNHPNMNFNLNKILYLDQKMLVGEYFNMIADKMTMANALEERVPYLDKEVVDFSFQLAPNLKLNENKEKFILKKLGKKFLPQIITERKKQGYGAPYPEWIKLGLGEIIINALENPEICKDKIIPKELINEVKIKIKNSPADSMRCWMLYSLEEWYKKFII